MLKEEVKQVRGLMMDFVRDIPKEEIDSLEKEHEMPLDRIGMLGDRGMMGLSVPLEYGGAGFCTTELLTVGEPLAEAWSSLYLIWLVQNSIAVLPVLLFGNNEQKEFWLSRFANGELGCFCLTEPSCGSDVASLKISAKETEDDFILNGTKRFITNAINGKMATVFARTGAKGSGSKGISAFILDLSTPGIILGSAEKKIALHASPICDVIFNECHIPKGALVGEKNNGFKIAMSTLNAGRLGVAMQAVGLAEEALRRAKDYGDERMVAGGEKKVNDTEQARRKYAWMRTEIDAVRALIFEAARLKDEGQPFVQKASEAKLKAARVALEVTREAVGIFGGNGFIADYDIFRLHAEAFGVWIYEGTQEIQEMIISKAEFGEL